MVPNKLFGKQIIALTLIIVSLFTAMKAQAATSYNSRSTWKVLAPQGGGFSVRMPGQPVKKADGRITMFTTTEQTTGRTYFYGVAHVDFSTLSANLEEKVGSECRDFAKGFNGEIVKWIPITKNGFKGIAARVESSNQSAIVASWLVSGRAYTIAFATQKIEVLPEEAKDFIDSFTFTSY